MRIQKWKSKLDSKDSRNGSKNYRKKSIKQTNVGVNSNISEKKISMALKTQKQANTLIFTVVLQSEKSKKKRCRNI